MLKGRALIMQRWLVEDALPFWWRSGYDRDARNFHERFDAEGTPLAVPRRVRSQARLTFSFARAVLLGWPGPWREAAEAGAVVLIEQALRPDGGTRHVLSADGGPTDDRRDLYDLSCVLLALASASRALDRADLLQHAERLLTWCNAEWAHPKGGFHEGEVADASVRRQNPHMHMMEALLALHEAGGAAAHLNQASDLATLMATRMFDTESETLAETFGDGWEQIETNRIIEPGHAFEWAWLLSRLGDLGGGDFAAVEDALRTKADQIGVYKRLVVDEVGLDGAVLKRSSRLWPNTERLKAHVVHFERTGDEHAAAFACDAVDAVWLYRNPRIAALCRDRAGIDGGWVDTGAPSSSVYHMMLAFSELFRVTGISAGSDASP